MSAPFFPHRSPHKSPPGRTRTLAVQDSFSSPAVTPSVSEACLRDRNFLLFLPRYSSTQAVASGGYTLLAQRQQQVYAVKEFVKQRNGVIRDGGEHGVSQHGFAPPVRRGHGIQQNVASQIHQRHQTHNRVGALPLSGCVGRAIIFTQLRFIRCPELCAINGKKLQAVPVILQVTFRAPCLCGLAEEPFHRGGPHALTRLGDSAAGQQIHPRFAIRAQV